MLQLQLNRVDYCHIGTTSHKCLKLIENQTGESKQQKVNYVFSFYLNS
jgi:hypothetical protein